MNNSYAYMKIIAKRDFKNIFIEMRNISYERRENLSLIPIGDKG